MSDEGTISSAQVGQKSHKGKITKPVRTKTLRVLEISSCTH